MAKYWQENDLTTAIWP